MTYINLFVRYLKKYMTTPRSPLVLGGSPLPHCQKHCIKTVLGEGVPCRTINSTLILYLSLLKCLFFQLSREVDIFYLMLIPKRQIKPLNICKSERRNNCRTAVPSESYRREGGDKRGRGILSGTIGIVLCIDRNNSNGWPKLVSVHPFYHQRIFLM